MLKTDSFKRLQYVFKWKWGGYDENGSVTIEELDWLRPDKVVKRSIVSRKQFSDRYRRDGIGLKVNMELPALIRVTETTTANGVTQIVTGPMEIKMPSEYRLTIRWRKEDAGNGLQKITVAYPKAELLDYSMYPDRAFYFLVNYRDEPWEKGARFYLPRPTGGNEQVFWFDTTANCEISLRMDGRQPIGENGLFCAKEVFVIK